MSISPIKKNGVLNLPNLRGRLEENAPLGKSGWFKCGGSADILYKPADLEDLQYFLQSYPEDQPLQLVGALSNTIVRDGGVPGVSIRLGRAFTQITIEDNLLKAGAFALDANVSRLAADEGVGGLEFFSGIPGSIGGALTMNAGCYGSETKDILVECEVLDRKGNLHILTPDQMTMGYRHVDVPEGTIFIGATFRGSSENPEEVHENIKEVKQKREESQPLREKTGGSTFANPSTTELTQVGLNPDMKVWQLIDQVGGRALQIGGAQMSEKHCNFMINNGNASAGDLENLGEEVKRRVYEQFGLTLRWEIKRIGLRK